MDQKVEKERYQKPLKQKYIKTQEQVTEDTQIPEMPKDIIQLPNEETFKTQKKKLNEQIQFLKKEQQTFIDDTKSALKSKKSVNQQSIGPLKDEQIEKQKKFKEFKTSFDAARQNLENKKQLSDELQEQADKIKLKMKNQNYSAQQITEQIVSLKDQISNHKISLKQEKDIVQQIQIFESILTFAYQHDEIQKNLKAALAEKKLASQAYFVAKESQNTLKSQCEHLKDQINDFYSMTQEEKNSIQPLIDGKIKEITDKITKIEEQIKTAEENYYNNIQKHEDQQKLIEKIEWIKKEKKNIIQQKKAEKLRQEVREKKEKEFEERRKYEQDLQKELESDTYNENVSICNLLIDYVKKLMPKQLEKQTQAEQQTVDVSSILKSKQWAKDNVTLIECKKDLDNDITNIKSKKQKKNQQQFEAKPEQINHKVEVINYFDHVKVTPPLYTNQLLNCHQLLSEKKEYFEKMPNKNNNEEKKEEKKKDDKPKKIMQKADFQESSFPKLD